MNLLFKQLRMALVITLAICGSAVSAADAIVRDTAPEGKRWLLIVETSSAMQRMRSGTLDSIRELLEGEMSGQLKPQDTIGVWVFDRELHTGKLPLQRWPASGKNEVVSRIVEFINSQSFEAAPNLQSMTEPLLGLASRSDLLTVVLVSSGTGRLTGTPFDREIDEAWFSWSQSRSKRPVITVLRVLDGKFVQHSVTPADFAVEMPALPPKPAPKEKPKKTVASPVVPRPKKNLPPPSTRSPATSAPVAPLIFSGPNKPEPAEPPVSTTESTNRPVVSTNIVTVPAPLPTNVVTPATQTVTIPTPPPPKPVVPANTPALVSTQAFGKPETNLVHTPAKSPGPGYERTGTVAEARPISEPTPPPRSAVTNVSIPTPGGQPSNPPVALARPPEKAAETNSAASLPAGPSPSQASHRNLYIAGGASALILAVGAIVLLSRRKSRSHVSLITESVDQDWKDQD
jgi:hypothetical protein